jgi:uncharacterized membrane protein YfcA
MSFLSWLILWYSGILIGLLSGLVGIGGGTILLPLLINLGYSPIESVSTSSLVISLTTLSSCIRNYSMGHFDVRRIVFLATPTVLIAPLGVYLGSKIPSFILLICFGIFLAINIFLANIRKNLQQKQNEQLENESAINIDDSQQNIDRWLELELDRWLLEQASSSSNKSVFLGETPNAYKGSSTVISASLEKKSPPQSKKHNNKNNLNLARLITGAISGFLAGIFGIGGGAIMVPMQMLLLKENIKIAIQTSLGVILITSVSNLLIYAQQGNIQVVTGLTLGFGGLCGAQIGSYYLPKLSNKTVNFIFNIILAILSANMFWQAGVKYCAIAPCA